MRMAVVGMCMCVSGSVVSDSASPRIAARQAPLSWDCPSKSTGVGCQGLLQWIFLTQVSNPGLLHCRRVLYRLRYSREVLVVDPRGCTTVNLLIIRELYT